ncbi:TrbG/VirB9 family P-type conjugative transfer protein [Arsenophonus nasoniae]|uniref:TrbG/VirB9 family P-type conjugative transfer protein n=1 Tax=Arsenophonus nasoniae TaxID=638 RepID=A0AA95G8R8_9GAMM|nr:TrbG/VirB9 family P-type conjugative transfer protein [Arsenophonus nasoniae]WGL94062.1 TrbG/VirB9 family P-type conjugative transfer protein [Arsenophonus nasoniae]
MLLTKTKYLAVFIGLLGLMGNAQGAILPKSGGFDNRVQEVTYNPDDVTIIRAKAGAVTLIQFESSEFVKGDSAGLGIGDPLAWNITVKGNNVFLRPIAEQPDTNIIIVTNKRTYSLLLTTAKKNPTFILRFLYPKPFRQTVFFGEKQAKFPCGQGNVVNLKYEVRGSQKIKPNAIWDNGLHTCFRWNQSVDLPIAFRILPDGNEQLVNYHMEKNVMVVHDVSPEFILRLGNEVMEVKTKNNIPRTYNEKGTTTRQTRFEKE